MRNARTLRIAWAAVGIGLLALIATACADDGDEPEEMSDEAAEQEAPEPVDEDVEEDEDAEDDVDESGDGGDEQDSGDANPIILAHPGATRPIWAVVHYYIAEEFGFYDDWEVDVDIRPMRSGGDVTQAAHTREIDVGYAGTDPYLAAVPEGVDLAAIMGQDNTVWHLVTTNPDIESCEDMEGHTSGAMAPGDARHLVLSLLLESCGLSIDDVDTVDTTGDHAGPLIAGVLDTHVLQPDEIAFVESETGEEMRVLVRLMDVEPLHYGIEIANTDSLEENREGFVRLLAAHIETIRFMHDPDNHDEIVDYLVTIVEQDDRDLVEGIYSEVIDIPVWQLDEPGLDGDILTNSIEMQHDVGNISELYDYEEAVDPTVWEEAFERVESGS